MSREPDTHSGQITDSDPEISDLIERSIALLIRRRWVVLGTMCATALGTITLLFQLPKRYTSEATIFAVQQRVPERYVVATATSDLGQALEGMVQEVMSRPQLLAIINELGLYPNERQGSDPEHLIQLMRRDVTVEPIERKLGRGEVNAFKVSFVGDTPKMAQAVAQRLTTLFIEQNLRTRADQATTTTEFLREQLESAKQDLLQQEQRLRDFKMQYLGELPEQQQSNLGILGGLQAQVDNVMAARTHAQQQCLYLESLMNEYQRRSRRSTTTALSSTGQIITPLQSAEIDLNRLQTERKALLASYTRNHPDVLRKDQEIELQKTFVETLKTAKMTVSNVQQPSREDSPASEEDIVVAQLRSQLQANRLEVDNLVKKESTLRTAIDQYHSRLNLTPVREQQLTSMQRDYELLRQHYADLSKKEQESQLATDLEKRQEGQQFRLADPPNLPTVPSSPKQVKISAMGILGGLVLGCAFAFLAEMRNSSFRSENDVRRRFDLPLVLGVPLLFTPAEQRTRSQKAALEWLAGSTLILIVALAEIYVWRRG